MEWTKLHRILYKIIYLLVFHIIISNSPAPYAPCIFQKLTLDLTCLKPISGEDLVPEPTDEAEEANEGGAHPPGPHPHRGPPQHLPPLPEQHRQQRVPGAPRPPRPRKVRESRAPVTSGRAARPAQLVVLLKHPVGCLVHFEAPCGRTCYRVVSQSIHTL